MKKSIDEYSTIKKFPKSFALLSFNIYAIAYGDIKNKKTKFKARIVIENLRFRFFCFVAKLETSCILFFAFFNELIIKSDKKNINPNGNIIELKKSIKIIIFSFLGSKISQNVSFISFDSIKS